MENFVHAVFPNQRSASCAVEHLVDAGFPAAQISALLRRNGRVQELGVRHKTGILIGALTGALLGGALGALALPGSGLMSIGPLFSTLEATIAGGALGILCGTLGGLGYWKEAIDIPAAAFESGAVLIGVTTNEERVSEARAALESAGAEEAWVTNTH